MIRDNVIVDENGDVILPDPEVLKDYRPIYASLPIIHSEFASVDYLTDSGLMLEYWETIYLFWNQNLNNFLNFDGSYDNFTVNQLDALSFFFGFNDEWYNKNWTKDQKIKLFKGVYGLPYIWNNRGSIAVFNYIMDALSIPGNLSKRSAFIAGISKAGDICGSPGSSSYIIYVPQNFNDTPLIYDSLQWILSHFIPLHVRVELVPTDNESLLQRPNAL